jgi:hypothetical protein
MAGLHSSGLDETSAAGIRSNGQGDHVIHGEAWGYEDQSD